MSIERGAIDKILFVRCIRFIDCGLHDLNSTEQDSSHRSVLSLITDHLLSMIQDSEQRLHVFGTLHTHGHQWNQLC